MPERAELRRKTGQRNLLIASYKRLEERLSQGRDSCGGGSPCPCTLGAARVPASQAAAPPSCSTLTGAELPQAKSLQPVHTGSLWQCPALCDPADCGLPGFSVRDGGLLPEPLRPKQLHHLHTWPSQGQT